MALMTIYLDTKHGQSRTTVVTLLLYYLPSSDTFYHKDNFNFDPIKHINVIQSYFMKILSDSRN